MNYLPQISESHYTKEFSMRSGLAGLLVFYFYSAKYTQQELYEKKGYDTLDIILERVAKGNFTNPYILVEIGVVLNFLVREGFLEEDDQSIWSDLDTNIYKELFHTLYFNFGFENGLLKFYRYYLQRSSAYSEIGLKTILNHLFGCFRISGYNSHPVDALYLLPSDIIEDIKIFILELESRNLFYKETTLLKELLNEFENRQQPLQTNYPEYEILQKLRKTKFSLHSTIEVKKWIEILIGLSEEEIIRGLATMKMNQPHLPDIWELL